MMNSGKAVSIINSELNIKGISIDKSIIGYETAGIFALQSNVTIT